VTKLETEHVKKNEMKVCHPWKQSETRTESNPRKVQDKNQNTEIYTAVWKLTQV